MVDYDIAYDTDIDARFRARFRPYFDSDTVSVQGSGIKSVRHLSYSSLNRQLDLPYHLASQFRPRKAMRSLVVAHFLTEAAEVVDGL